MYKELENRAKEILQNNIEIKDDSLWKRKRCIVPSRGPYLGAWNWDSAFHANTVSRWDSELAYEQIDIFLENQCEDGKLPDAIMLIDNSIVSCISKPPVMPWAFVNVYKRKQDFEKLQRAYDVFVKNESFWVNKRSQNGLFHYDCDGLVEDYVKYSKFESGWDTSVRFDNGCSRLWAIDLNCYMVLFYDSLIFMARELGKASDVSIWMEKKATLTTMINDVLWDSEKQIYCDYDYVDNKFTEIFSPASFMPLFVGIASQERAEFLYKHASDVEKFYPCMPTVSYDNPRYTSCDYWRGPTWLNTAYFAAKGLYNYGYKEIAQTIKETILGFCDKEKRSIFEYYDSRTGKGLGAEGFSWSCCFIIEFLEEII